MAIIKLIPPPLKDNINGLVPQVWVTYFERLYRNVLSTQPSVSADNGDTSVTLTCLKSALTQIYNSPLTTNRTVTLSTVSAFNGARFRIVRTSSATGAFNLSVGGLKNLTVGQFCTVEYNGSAWMLTSFGSL